MAKNAKTIHLQVDESGKLQHPPVIEIKSAQLKDFMCNYSYELVAGTGEGDLINRKGSAIVHDDMQTVFKKLNVHLALICEEVEPDLIEEVEVYENMEFGEDYEANTLMHRISRYRVSGLKLGDEGEGHVQLEGVKILSSGEHVGLKTPKIKWEGNYSFLNELRVCIDDIKMEVEAYMNGKAAPRFEQQELEFGEEEEQDEDFNEE